MAPPTELFAKGVTVNLGVRVEKEYLPAENQPTGPYWLSRLVMQSWRSKHIRT